jgi:nitrogen regulatory protein P-II 1
MKKIEAIVRSSKISDIKRVLHRRGFDGMTITEAHGYGREKGPRIVYRGSEVHEGFVPRLKVELLVEEDRAHDALDAIFEAAHTGELGDGRIYVTNVETEVHIRTGETIYTDTLHPVGS